VTVTLGTEADLNVVVFTSVALGWPAPPPSTYYLVGDYTDSGKIPVTRYVVIAADVTS
jgi:hypothetical protein